VRAALVAAATNGASRVKGQAVQQLLNSGAPEGLQLAEAAITGNDADMARQMMWGLANRGADGARILARAASSSDAQIRAAAAGALGNSGEPSSVDTLVGMSRDSDQQVRSAALSALGQVGSDKAVTAVLDAASTGKPEERIAALWPLSQIEDPRAEQTLTALMTDEDESIATSAMSSSYNGGAAVDRTLASIVADDNASQSRRYTAAQQLRSRGVALDETTRAKIDALLGAEGERNVHCCYDF